LTLSSLETNAVLCCDGLSVVTYFPLHWITAMSILFCLYYSVIILWLINCSYLISVKPECAITQREIESQTRLICDVTANPRDVSFTWLFQNTTLHEGVTSRGLQSVFTLDHGVSPLGTYSCYAKNDIGTSIPCEIDVTGKWFSGIF